jgi:hypothetical protein
MHSVLAPVPAINCCAVSGEEDSMRWRHTLLLWAEQPEKSAFRPALILTSILETNKRFETAPFLMACV